MGYFDHTVAFKITHNEGNYTRGGLRVPSPRDQAESIHPTNSIFFMRNYEPTFV